jgi:hypothetical protein
MYLNGFKVDEMQLSPQEEAIAMRFEDRPSRIDETHDTPEGIRYMIL